MDLFIFCLRNHRCTNKSTQKYLHIALKLPQLSIKEASGKTGQWRIGLLIIAPSKFFNMEFNQIF